MSPKSSIRTKKRKPFSIKTKERSLYRVIISKTARRMERMLIHKVSQSTWKVKMKTIKPEKDALLPQTKPQIKFHFKLNFPNQNKRGPIWVFSSTYQTKLRHFARIIHQRLPIFKMKPLRIVTVISAQSRESKETKDWSNSQIKLCKSREQ